MLKFPYAKQSICEEDKNAVVEALAMPLITRGEKTEAFERALGEVCEVPFVVVFSSGTAALQAAAFAAEISPADVALTTPNTFIATALAPRLYGARVEFLDIDTLTGNFSLEALSMRKGGSPSRGRIILLPVHFSGIAMDMKALVHMLTFRDVVIIEDAAHALGSYYPSGEKVGSCVFSDMTVFSFHASKVITTGEGGAVTTRDPYYAKRLRAFRDNGICRLSTLYPGYYEVEALTGNFHITEMGAALGISQLCRLSSFVEKRNILMKRYRERLPYNFLSTQSTTAFHLCVVQIDFLQKGKTRDGVMKALRERGIGTQVHYIPLYRHPVFRGEPLPCMEEYFTMALTLPLYVDLEEEDVDWIVEEVVAATQL